jgi:membrane-bound ClpP family serine protease
VVIKRAGALLVLGIMLLGFSAIPVHTQEDSSKIHKMTIEQAVELALENNLQVKIAQADKKKKDVAYAYAKTLSRTINPLRRNA